MALASRTEPVSLPSARQLTTRFVGYWLATLVLTGFASNQLISMLLGLGRADRLAAAAQFVPVIAVCLGLGIPWLLIFGVVRRAIAHAPHDRGGDRLSRILELPRRVELITLQAWVLGTLVFVVAVQGEASADPIRGLLALAVGVSFGALTGLVLLPRFQALVEPLALDAFLRDPSQVPRGGGYFWPRQRWYLPYAVAVILVAAITFAAVISLTKLREVERRRDRILREGGPEMRRRLDEIAPQASREIALNLGIYGALVLLAGGMAARGVAVRQEKAKESILRSLQGLAKGELQLPRWVATDEMGDLAVGTTQLMGQLDEVPKILRNSAVALAAAAEHLTATSNEQGSYLRNQAAALEQTRRTAETIRRGSMGAAEQTDVALKGAERADRVGVAGTESISQSRAALAEIRTEVSEIAVTIRTMDDRSRQIGQVAETMQDLVEQTHVLAVNAAIEAARSGEQGVGFAVVAREMRTLVDKSAQAAAEVRQLLEKVLEASGDAVERTLQGEKRVESGLAQIEASGEKLRELLLINQSSSSALRQIAGIVRQQTTGVSEIFDALSSQQNLMDQTLARVESTVSAVESLEMVSREVELAMKGFGGST